MFSGEARGMTEAIELARAETGESAAPSIATVRRHLEALRQASLGLSQWAAARLNRLEALEELLQTIAYVAPECTIYVTGRAAEGHVDDTGPANVRVVGASAPPLLMDDLEAHGVPAMGVTNTQTPYGGMACAEVDGPQQRCRLLFLPDQPWAHDASSVADGRPIAKLDLEGFARLIGQAREELNRDRP